MEIKVKSYSSQSSLISSIIFFIIGAILFTNAEKVVSTMAFIIGIILATIGIVEFIVYLKKRKDGENQPIDLGRGIALIAISLIFIFASNIVEQIIRFIIGAWILFSGISRLISVLTFSNKNTKFLPLLIVSFLLIGIGIYTIVVGDVVLSTIGIIMMIYAAIDIIGYIFYTKDTLEKEEPGATTLIIPAKDDEDNKEEKKTKKTKNVKEKKSKNKEE